MQVQWYIIVKKIATQAVLCLYCMIACPVHSSGIRVSRFATVHVHVVDSALIKRRSVVSVCDR